MSSCSQPKAIAADNHDTMSLPWNSQALPLPRATVHQTSCSTASTQVYDKLLPVTEQTDPLRLQTDLLADLFGLSEVDDMGCATMVDIVQHNRYACV